MPKGPNVGIITNTGGPAIIATDECVEGGLNIPDISEETKKYLKVNLFPEASVSNPVDVLATAGPKEWTAAIEALLKDQNIDSLLINFVTPFFVDCVGVAKEMQRITQDAGRKTQKPIVINAMTDKKQWVETLDILKSAGLPTYDIAETAARALVAMVKYGEYQRRPPEKSAKFTDAEKSAVQQIINNARKSGREFLSLGEAMGVLYAYKIPTPKYLIAETPDDILKSVNYVGYPLVLKIDSLEAIHKTEKGGVVLNITTKEQLTKELKNLQSKFGTNKPAYMIQEYLTGGKEAIIGASWVEELGHLVMFGLGGVFVEVMKDVAFKVAPLTEHEARGMVQSIKGYPILAGVRGEKGIDLAKLTEIILRVSQLLSDCPEIKELDLNPVMVYPEANRCKVVDVRIRV